MTEHLDFTEFASPVNKQFLALTESGNPLFYTDVDVEALYQEYQNAYPAEVNTVFRKRRHYDGSYDKNYIRRLGNVVSLSKDGTIDTIWNVKVPGYFQDVADKLHSIVSKAEVTTPFLVDNKTAGSPPNKDTVEDITWSHFYTQVPSLYISKSIGEFNGRYNESVGVFTRGLTEFTVDALETVKELIDANSLYRGTEFKKVVTVFLELKKAYDKLPPRRQKSWISYQTAALGLSVRFKNSVIGTLVEDLSAGIELEKAVRSFESKVAPTNYKRPTAVVTPRMLEDARNKIESLGLTSALARRHATVDDIPLNNILFTNRSVKSFDVLDNLSAELESKVVAKPLSKVEEISLDHFLDNILPNSKSVEVLFENKHVNNLVSLITAKEADSANLFKWDNPFSWSYNGEVADSMKDRVKAFGGNTDGVLRFSIQWNEDHEPNSSDLDAHAKLPSGKTIYYANPRDHVSGGTLDVDIRRPDGVAVENIIFTDSQRMGIGDYDFYVHNFAQRVGKGFSAEIEFDGQLFTYVHDKRIPDKAHVPVATVTLNKDRTFTMKTDLSGSTRTLEAWGLKTNHWVNVNSILLSPNVWNEETRSGNEHLFFIVDDCVNDSKTRGIYNEFLRPEFEPHRKVFELLGEKTKVEVSDKQASGLGFSSTRRDKVTVRVAGKTKRVFTINL